ncbi:MAG: AraC family transcriptional regulator [Clostridiales bacterium]|nr:AraC family transcriptional regulator [Clostridiales bacterium]
MDIASLTGYSDQSYYTKKFTRITGMTPGQYRKKRAHLDGN